METERLIILGSGPAGLTAAIYAARFGLDPLVIEGPVPGGQLTGTSFVENWPGVLHVPGPSLMGQLRAHTVSLNVRFKEGLATKISGTAPLFTLLTDKNESFTSNAIIVSTGALPRKLGCAGEEMYWGKGVSTCAACDGPLFAEKRVVIVGGGNSALENALFLLKFKAQITIVHERDALTATEKQMLTDVLKSPHITILYNSTVHSIEGDGEKVTAVTITTQEKGLKKLETDGVFLAIGQTPCTNFLTSYLELTPSKHIQLKEYSQTSIPGIFAAGDVADSRYRQAITAAGMGCMAALDAYNYLKKFALLLN
ncbi:TPA: thioredoxin-disulfide reductase [Candidatus Dependentiae bacterium]|nr:MAG: Thioredoxin reductase [candidate division TM6 bacterium GW2011_GWF2_43_87]HBL98788.1 thioredoxin-disulfide reductase [Candidatus Dependentiae bacterium]